MRMSVTFGTRASPPSTVGGDDTASCAGDGDTARTSDGSDDDHDDADVGVFNYISATSTFILLHITLYSTGAWMNYFSLLIFDA